MAGRLQGLAEPGTVVVDKTTRALVGELFNCRDLGASARAWQGSGVRDVERRFEALRGASANRAGSLDEAKAGFKRRHQDVQLRKSWRIIYSLLPAQAYQMRRNGGLGGCHA